MDYPYIRVWHRMTGSYQYYIDMMVDQARKDQATETAIYKDTMTGQWYTVEDVRDQRTRKALERQVQKMKEDEHEQAQKEASGRDRGGAR